MAWHGEVAELNPPLYTVIDAAGLSHSKGMKSYLIMMAVRLIEMERILEPTGSIDLHCDDTASHYLKQLMDVVFGKANYRNEIVWQRNNGSAKGSQHEAKKWGRNTDSLLYYVLDSKTPLKPCREMTPEERLEKYPKRDEQGRPYATRLLFCGRSMGPRPNLCYEWKGFTNPYESGWRLSKPRLEEEYAKGNVVILPNGKLERRAYMSQEESRGVPPDNNWTDIPRLTNGKEKNGYPTQKLLALLERIIKASSNKGDVVFDPFCGCATTLEAAENPGRQWVGIDISDQTLHIIKNRLLDAQTLNSYEPLKDSDIVCRQDIPRRTDLGKLPHYGKNRHTLFGKQEGRCNGCRGVFPFAIFDVDHIIPRAEGGTDHIDNLQLLCSGCNRLKGKRSMSWLVAELKKQGRRQ